MKVEIMVEIIAYAVRTSYRHLSRQTVFFIFVYLYFASSCSEHFESNVNKYHHFSNFNVCVCVCRAIESAQQENIKTFDIYLLHTARFALNRSRANKRKRRHTHNIVRTLVRSV